MLVLNANQEQKHMFNELIQAIGAQVVWNGRFIIMGDRMILEGFVRSLFLHFDIQKAEVTLTDLPMEDETEFEMADHPGLEDLITMAVYAFEAWDIFPGLKVEQDAPQLEQMFGEVLGRYALDVVFSGEQLEFYESGMRITYEDVVEKAIASAKGMGVQAPRQVLKMPEWIYGSGNAGKAKGIGVDAGRDAAAAAQRIQKYRARIGVLDRLSDLQKKTLLRDIRFDKHLSDNEKEELYDPIRDHEYKERMRRVDEELADGVNRTYAHVCRMIEKAEKEELFEKTKTALLERLCALRQEYGIAEVRLIMEQAPAHVERAEYQQLMENLAPYEEIDLAEYKEPLRKMRETLEIKEISNMLMNSAKKSRADYVLLLRQMEEKDFARENAAPYVDRILEWIGEFDKARLNKLLSRVGMMDFETAASLYAMILKESFLPGLRTGALTVVSRRLAQIGLGECKILADSLRERMSGVIRENPRHHFYPARKLLQNTAVPEDTRLIDSAVAAYAEKKGIFEYPVFMVDTSKDENGRDGMLLTPEHLFYSTRLSGYRIPVTAIRSIHVSSGLLNHKSLIAEEESGVRHKLPFAVSPEELQDWAQILGQLVRQLKAEPVCAKLSYDALEQQGTVSCTRCGCVFSSAEICPECGLHIK